MVFFSFTQWRFVLSEIRCLDRSFAFGSYFRVRSSYKKTSKALKTLKPFKNLKNLFFVKIQVLPSSPDTNNKVKSERETDFNQIQWQQLRTRGTESAMAV